MFFKSCYCFTVNQSSSRMRRYQFENEFLTCYKYAITFASSAILQINTKFNQSGAQLISDIGKLFHTWVMLINARNACKLTHEAGPPVKCGCAGLRMFKRVNCGEILRGLSADVMGKMRRCGYVIKEGTQGHPVFFLKYVIFG